MLNGSSHETSLHIQTHNALAGGSGQTVGSHVASCFTLTSQEKVPTGAEHDVSRLS